MTWTLEETAGAFILSDGTGESVEMTVAEFVRWACDELNRLEHESLQLQLRLDAVAALDDLIEKMKEA